MTKNKLGMSVLGLTTVLFALGNAQQSSLANEFIAEATSSDQATTSLSVFETADSYRAADLKIFSEEFAQAIQDLDTFCQRYPLNSRCFDREVIQEEDEDELEFEAMDEPAETSGFAVTPNISTLGLGAGVTARVTPNINASLGINGLPFETDFEYEGDSTTTASQIEYEGDLDIFNVSAIGSYYPSADNGFHISGGIVFNTFEVEGTGTANGTVEVGNDTFTATDGVIETDASFENDVSPYVAIGWGNPVRPGSRFSFFGNIGVMFTGSPEVNATVQNPGAFSNTDPAGQSVQEALDEEVQELEDDIDFLGGVYPILTLGVSYQF